MMKTNDLTIGKSIDEAVRTLSKRLDLDNAPLMPRIGLVLGSGLGHFAESLFDQRIVSYADLPHFKVTSVPGHAGQFVYGILQKQNISVLVAQGRVHFYEGYDLSVVTFVTRVMAKLGIKNLILTNAGGSVNPSFKVGDFMVLDDHLNLMGTNPLIGWREEELGSRFVDMSEPYAKQHNDSLLERMQKRHPAIRVQRGTYAALSGPSYETPAEIRMLRTLGADAVGMSTVPECIVGRQCKMVINAITSITNLGSGLNQSPLSHEEVAQSAKKMAPQFCTLLEELITLISSR